MLPFWAMGGLVDRNILYSREDSDQTQDLTLVEGHDELEARMIRILRDALTEISAPDDLFVRLGL
jgi:hypothetical protein